MADAKKMVRNFFMKVTRLVVGGEGVKIENEGKRSLFHLYIRKV